MLTVEQHELRKAYITASDVPAICGIDPWQTAGDVYCRKIGLADPDPGNENTEWGDDLEPAIIRRASRRLGVEVRHEPAWHVAENGIMAATLDAPLLPTGEVFEAKYRGSAEGWGDDGSDVVPESVLIQVHAQMICTKAQVAIVGALLAGFRGLDFRLYRIHRSEDLCEQVESIALAFHRDHVVPRVPPSVSASLETYQRIRRVEGKSVVVPDELVENWRRRDGDAKEAAAVADLAKAAVLEALGDAEIGLSGLGKVTHKLQRSKRLDVGRIREEAPDVAARFTVESEHRVLRFSPNKGGAL